MGFTATLAVVGVLQLAVMFLTWLVYRRQAREMRRQRHEMRHQRHVMWQQWKSAKEQIAEMGYQRQVMFGQWRAIQEQVTEMSSQTEVLERNLEMVISKERARLVIELTDTQSLGLEIQEEGFPYHRSKSILLTHHGPTSAFNVSGRGTVFISKGPIPVGGEEPKGVAISLPTIMRPESPAEKVELFGMLGFGDITDAVRGAATLHMKAVIEYEDVFGNRRKTPLWYTWDVDRFQPDKTVDHWEEISEWIPWGEEANKAD